MSKWTVPCVRGLIGDRVYYSALLRADQIASRIEPAHKIREAKSLDDFLQRKLHDRREKIAKYLCTRSDRFFNSIIVGVFGGLPKWLPFDLHKAASDLAIDKDSLTSDTMGLLVFSGTEHMFAVDGQHRVEGIRIAHDKCPEIVKEDEYSVVFVAHIDDKQGKVQTRRLFSDINKRAVPVSNGDKVVIDEDELNAVVARRIYASYRHFKHGDLIANTEKEKLPEGDRKHFTNLLTLYAVNKRLRQLYRRVRGVPEYDPQNVTAFCEVVTTFYDFVVANIPSYHRYFSSKHPSLIAQRKNNRNLLFRPAGLRVLCALYVHFASQDQLPRLAQGLKIMKFESPGGVFDGVLWRDGKVGPRASDRTAAVNLCAYMLGLDIEPTAKLRERLAEVLRNDNYTLPDRVLQPPEA